MNFAPRTPGRVLHDTWAFPHEGRVHLFYLAVGVTDPMHRLIGHAVSENWLDWTELPFIDIAGPPGAWDSGRVGTGHTFRGADGGFYLAYTGRIDPEEAVGLAVSDDLISWRRLAESPVWPRSRAMPYETDAARSGMPPAWRDPYVFQAPGGGLEALLCARVATGPACGRGCVARARIGDVGAWELLPPLTARGLFPIMEVPELFEFGGCRRLTFNSHSGWGRRLDTASRANSGGTYYLNADSPAGPWRQPADGLLIGSGQGRRDAVVARSVLWRGDRLVYHHYTGDMSESSPRALGLPKRLAAAGEDLFLEPWEGLTPLRRGALHFGDWDAPDSPACAGGEWHADGSGWLSGAIAAGGAVRLTRGWSPDADVEVVVRSEGAERAGVLCGTDSAAGGGILFLLDFSRGEITLGSLAAGPYGAILDRSLDVYRTRLETGRGYCMRVLRRDRYVELYVDGRLVFCTIVGPAGGGDRLGAVIDGGRAGFRIGEAYRLVPMPR